MIRYFVALILLSIATLALADSTAQTTPQTFVSSLNRFRLTVFPLEDPQAIFGTHADWMVKLPPSVQRTTPVKCEATLERWVGNTYELVWRKPLVNQISPGSALVSDVDGSFVTFDDWGNSGHGDNVVVIYSGSGDMVKRFSLSDLMTEEQIEKLPGSIGSIYWGGNHILINSDGTLLLRVGTNNEYDNERRRYRDIEILMRDGRVVTPAALPNPSLERTRGDRGAE